MTRFVCFILIYSLCASAALSQQPSTPGPNDVVHVVTALNHLTILEFHEPVTMVAAGSSDFQIEREANKVFVKPVKSGAATDLFVWTASRRFAYELEITSEVKDLNFAIDNAPPATPPSPKPVAEIDPDQFVDMAVPHVLLGAEDIKQRSTRRAKNQVVVRVEQLFRTPRAVYIYYTIENSSGLSYRVNTPQAYQLQMGDSSLSIASLTHTQLDRTMLQGLRDTPGLALPVAHAESEVGNLHPGETTHGVVSIGKDLKSPAVVQLVFADGVKAAFVL